MFRGNFIIKALFFAKIIATLFFAFDVAFDIREHIYHSITYESGDIIHLLFEIFAVFALIGGVGVSLKYQQRLRLDNQTATRHLYRLRVDFDEHVKSKFTQWGLTSAEQDIALLTLRGLKNSDIAELRNTALGTVKLQSHKVLQKSGASSRTEFMSIFMEEFMDVGMDKQ
tara:strand:- start:731 stop:1240 length:510 start_codon:yes stop_codon:yes gene_type:complete